MPQLINSKELRRIFEMLDKNGDGLLSLEELNWLLEMVDVKFSTAELESLVEKENLQLDEFVSFYLSISDHTRMNDRKKNRVDEKAEEEDIFKAFEVFDLNKDGYISSEELESVLCRLGLWEENCGKDSKTMINVYDTNLDGKLDFEEFKNMMMLHIS